MSLEEKKPIPPLLNTAVPILFVGAVLYNAGLAFINAHVFSLSTIHVAATEGLIALGGTMLVLTNTRSYKSIWPSIALIFVAILLALWVSASAEFMFIKGFRDYYLIALFVVIGSLMNEKQMQTSFLILTAVVFGVLMIEAFKTDLYIFLFEPALYYANTRGIEASEFGPDGLFGNTMLYEGRFSFGIFNSHRMASIFLEQVSLGNFAIIISLFLSRFWNNTSWFLRGFYILTIIMIMLTTSSRASIAFSLFIFMGYFIFAYLPRYLNVVYMPVILVLAGILFYDPYITSMVDTLGGRIGYTVYRLISLEMSSIFTGNIHKVSGTADSGYTYVIYSQTIIGLIYLWLFTSLITPQDEKPAKRLAHGITFFMFANLLIGSNSFTIKLAAPLWVLAGFDRGRKMRAEIKADTSDMSSSPDKETGDNNATPLQKTTI